MSPDSMVEENRQTGSILIQTLEIIGIFALVGVGIGFTGGMAVARLGSGEILVGLVTIVVLTITFLLGPVIAVISGLRTGDGHGCTPESLLAALIGSAAGYFVMMFLTLFALSLAISFGSGGGGGAATDAATQTPTPTSSTGDGLPLGEYLGTIVSIAIPTGLAGLGGVVLGGRRQRIALEWSISRPDLPWKYIGAGGLALLLIVAGVTVVPTLFPAYQLQIQGDSTVDESGVYAEGDVQNILPFGAGADLTVELYTDGKFVSGESRDITVAGRDTERLNIRVASASELSALEDVDVATGDYFIRYKINGHVVETYRPSENQG